MKRAIVEGRIAMQVEAIHQQGGAVVRNAPQRADNCRHTCLQEPTRQADAFVGQPLEISYHRLTGREDHQA